MPAEEAAASAESSRKRGQSRQTSPSAREPPQNEQRRPVIQVLSQNWIYLPSSPTAQSENVCSHFHNYGKILLK